MKIPINAAIHLVHEARNAGLATNSTQLPGYPYATPVPLVVDERHQPILLISTLAEHTKNLLADPRASLAVVENQNSNTQTASRMTLVGTFKHFEPTENLVARYLRYQAEAEQYLGLDFKFFRLFIQRVRYIAGIGQMGWLEASDWSRIHALGIDAERKLLEALKHRLPASIRLIGIDAYGVDYEIDGLRRRQRSADVITSETCPQYLEILVTRAGSSTPP